MGTQTNELVKYENGFILKNFGIATVIFCCISLLMIIFLLFIVIGQLITDIQANRFWDTFLSIILIGILTFSCILLNNIEKIIINTKENEIMFRYGVILIYKKKKLKFNNIKEILISHKPDDYITMPNRFQTFVREKMYSIDIIDKEQNAYRIAQSENYNDEFIEFSKKLGEILNVPVDDQNNIEYNKLLYKRII